jgi:ABC-2 type transport system ATP-binding protein
MSSSPSPVIKARDLSKKFGRFVAVNHISFEIAPGEIFGFLGPNGAGKTTTIRLLCGLSRPTGGRCTVLDIDPTEHPYELKKSIGYMSQRFSLYDELTAIENLNFYADIYGVANSKPASVIDYLELTNFLAYRASELPTGLRQRLALGCALIHNPRVIFLDEPTAGMDPLSRRSFWELIHRLVAEQKTVLVTTHYLDEAEYCFRLGLMNQGKFIAIGSPAELKTMVPGTILRIDCRPLELGLQILLAMPDVGEPGIYGNTIRLFTENPAAAESRLKKEFETRNVTISAIARDEPSLEDIFGSLVRR